MVRAVPDGCEVSVSAGLDLSVVWARFGGLLYVRVRGWRFNTRRAGRAQWPTLPAGLVLCRESLLVVVRRQIEHELDRAVVCLERKHAADHEKCLARILELDEVARLRYVRALVIRKAGAGLLADGFRRVFGEFDRDVGGHASPVG